MRLLALDTTLAACSAAVWLDGSVRAARTEALERGHAERLMPLIEIVMSEAAVRYEGLDAIAVTVGPGSFTGVRIGLATARGLGLAAGRPVIGLTTLEVIAHAAGGDVAVALGAGRGWVYVQHFGPDAEPLAPPAIEVLDEARARIGGARVAGDAAALLLGPDDPRRVGPAWAEARFVAALAAHRFGAGRPLPTAPPAAFYLRPPDARPMAAP